MYRYNFYMTLLQRIQHFVFIVIFLANAWLLMQLVHECGHVLAAYASGGSVERVVLSPMIISRTDLATNPHPLFVAWSGALFGAVVPVILAALLRKTSIAYLLWGLAGFCLIANSIYLGAGALEGYGDAGDILRHGGEPWQLIVFALLTAPAGLYAWHRVSTAFGFGEGKGTYNKKHAVASIFLHIIILCAELMPYMLSALRA